MNILGNIKNNENNYNRKYIINQYYDVSILLFYDFDVTYC